MTGGDDEQEAGRPVTVAELIARSGQSGGGGRRHRRREREGGISVAELTGEIPVIRDAVPGPAEPQAPEQRGPAPEQPRPAEPEPAPEMRPEPEQRLDPAAFGAQPVPAAAGGLRDAATWTSVPAETAHAVATADVLGRDAADRDAVGHDDTADRDAVGHDAVDQDAVDRDPAQVDVAWEDGPADPEPEPGTLAFAAPWLVPQKRAAKPTANPAGAPVASVDVADEPAIAVARNTPDAPNAEAGELPDAAEHDDPQAGEGRRSRIAIAGQAVAGVVVAVALFFGFIKLWDVLPIVAAVLAVLVTVVVVTVVQSVYRPKTMLLAAVAVVGLVVTFVPLALAR